MMILPYKEYSIEFYNDSTYTLNSSDNLNKYDQVYFGGDSSYSKIGIKFIKNEELIKSILLVAGSYDNYINEDIVVVDDNKLLIAVCEILFYLNLDTLKLEWKTKVDLSACFKIYKFDNFYITHGELEVKRINKTGYAEWDFSGADIFVSPLGESTISFENNHIQLIDWNGKIYILDFNGYLIN